MSEAKHTAGEWFAAGRIVYTTAKDAVVELGAADDLPYYVDGDRFSQVRANARLMAAAPALLAACKRMNDFLCAGNVHGASDEGPNGEPSLNEIVESAIARAEGREG